METVEPLYARKLFLQAFLRNPCLLEDETRALHARVARACPDEEFAADLDVFVQQVNRVIDEFNLAIHHVPHHARQLSYYMLINQEADQVAKVATRLKPVEIDVFRKIVTRICESERGQISSMEALQCVPASGMGKATFEAQGLKKLQDDLWLEETSVGYYTLGVRTLRELKSYIQNQYDDLRRCKICEEVAVIGVFCGCSESIFHRRCLENFSGRKRCGACNEVVEAPNSLYPVPAEPRGGQRRRVPAAMASQGQHLSQDEARMEE